VHHSPILLETLRDAQRFGFFGERPIEDAVAHADHFVAATSHVVSGARLLDLGSGGGLPGLVVAEARRDLHVVLLDRRRKRTDFLERAVRRLDFDHVEVWARDAVEVVRSIRTGGDEAFDVVTARGFGPPDLTLRTAVACCVPGGWIVISEPPTGDRWSAERCAELGVTVDDRGPVIRFRRI
jgi:16S rRNA (guanine527-N7)-methyltransferase